MNNDVIEKIEIQVKQSLFKITGDVTPNIEVYDDIAVIEYELDEPCAMEDEIGRAHV